MKQPFDLTGRVFGDLTVIGRAGTRRPKSKGRGHRIALWECRCSCGQIVIVKGWSLRNAGRTTCWGRTHKRPHGKLRSYVTWSKMVARCTDPLDSSYTNYGGRGVSVSPAWRDFDAFYADMGDRPEGGYTIERIDVNGNYEPANCRWATKSEQARNKRDTVYVEHGGERHRLIDLCEAMGWNYRQVLKRYRRGWPLELAATAPNGTYLKSLAQL